MLLLDELVAIAQKPLRLRDELGPRASIRAGLEEAESHQDESRSLALGTRESLVELLGQVEGIELEPSAHEIELRSPMNAAWPFSLFDPRTAYVIVSASGSRRSRARSSATAPALIGVDVQARDTSRPPSFLSRRPEREQHERRRSRSCAPSGARSAREIGAAASRSAAYASSWRWCSQYAVRPIVTRLPSSVAAATALRARCEPPPRHNARERRRGEHGEHEDRERKLPATRLLEEIDCDTKMLDRSPDEARPSHSARSRSGRCT